MTNAELLQLDPRHLAELRSFYVGCKFAHVEIVAQEIAPNDLEDYTCGYAHVMSKLSLDNVFCGGDHTHCVFTNKHDDVFFCISIIKIGHEFEKIIFKLIPED